MRRILPVIVFSQFLCTSLWFAGNAIAPEIVSFYHLDVGFLAHLTSAVQLGFIGGCFLFALLGISDRYSPTWVFFVCSLVAALCNLGMVVEGVGASGLLLARFFTGFFLAGIYPVGMKIAADYYPKGLGKSLGFLVGALVVGTAFPHLLRSIGTTLPWRYVAIATSWLAVAGGTAMLLLVADGPYRKRAQRLKLGALFSGFRDRRFRAVVFGYFGHMWELYAFWAFVPVMLGTYNAAHPSMALNVPLLSFCIIAAGGIACGVSGYLSQWYGAKRVAMVSLALSGLCCLLSPLALMNGHAAILIGFLFFWGLVVIADSPMFSSLVAGYAAEESRGTALTIVTCVGFAITIGSIQLLGALSEIMSPAFLYVILALGPVAGVAMLRVRG